MSSVQIKDRIANLKQNKKNLPKLVTAENKGEGMNNMGETYFVESENNFDLNQSQNMLNAKNQMINDVHSNKKNMQAIGSIKDSAEYLGCLNNKCSNINENNSGQNIDNKINDTDTDSNTNNVVKKNTNKRIQNHHLNNYLNMQNELHKKMSANPDYIKNLLPNLDTVITTVYILLMSVLIIYSLVGKNNNLVSILVFTLVFIFYKNIVAYKNKYKK